MILFTRRYKVPKFKPSKLNRIELTIKEHTKHRGVILDKKLMRKLSMEGRVKRDTALYACKKMLASTCPHALVLHSGSQANPALTCFDWVERCQQNLIQKTILALADTAARCSLRNRSAKNHSNICTRKNYLPPNDIVVVVTVTFGRS